MPLFCTSKWVLAACIFIAGTLSVEAAPGNFLNIAILELPPKYLADIPLKERGLLLRQLSEGPYFGDTRLDYQHGYLDYYSDGGEVNASCPFYLKLLKRPDGPPLVFVHMKKTHNGEKPAKEHTVVLERTSEGWVDVSAKVFPKKVDRTWYFRPLRRSPQVELAPRNKRTYSPEKCEALLTWNGKQFEWKGIPALAFTEDSDHYLYVFSEPNESLILNMGGSTYSTVAELKKAVAALPKGSHLELDLRDRSPLLLPLSDEKLKVRDFRKFCESHHVHLKVSTCADW